VPGYALEASYRFGKRAKLLPGETPIRNAADMLNLGWHYDAPWGVGNGYFADFSKPPSPLGPNYVFEHDDLALVARHDHSDDYTKTTGKPHIASGPFLTNLTVQPPAIVEFMVELRPGAACGRHSGERRPGKRPFQTMGVLVKLHSGSDHGAVQFRKRTLTPEEKQ